MLDQPARAVQAARLLVGGAREQDVAPEARDRIARRVAGRRRPPGARAGAARRPRARPSPSCRPRPAPRRSRRRCRRRTAVGPALGHGRHDVEVREEQQRVAAGAVAAQPGDDAAPARAPARRPRGPGRRRAARPRSRFAASSSGPGGSGGLIDGMRIRSRRKPTSRSCASVQAASPILADAWAGDGPSVTLRWPAVRWCRC